MHTETIAAVCDGEQHCKDLFIFILSNPSSLSLQLLSSHSPPLSPRHLAPLILLLPSCPLPPLTLFYTPPPSLCVLKTCRQESLQREYFISVQLSSPLYIRDQVFPAKLCLPLFSRTSCLLSPRVSFGLSCLLAFCGFWLKNNLALSIAAVSRYAALFPTLPHFLFLASSRPPSVSFTETIIAL